MGNTNSTAKWIGLWFSVAVGMGLLVMGTPPARWHDVLIYALPIPTVGLLLAACRAWMQGVDRAAKPALWIGWMLIGGGVVFDIAATIVHSPDLSRESNPIARSLLDSGHPLTFVYSYSTAMQGIVLATCCVLWAGFLRHMKPYLTSAYEQGSRSYWHFLKAASGGGELTFRQWLLPLHLKDLPSAAAVLWFAVPTLVFSNAIYRTCLGLQWYDVLPYVNGLLLVAIIVGGAVLIELIWLWRAFSRLQ